MNRYGEIWRIMAILDTGYPILINFRQVRLKRLHMTYDARWHNLHNMASTGPVWAVVGRGGQQWSRVSSLNELDHLKAELRVVGPVFQVMECKALWDKIVRIRSNVACNGPVFVIVLRCDRLGPYFWLYYPFWAVLALPVRFDHIKIKVAGNRESRQKWPIII